MSTPRTDGRSRIGFRKRRGGPPRPAGREGTSISCDDLVIPADAEEVELAHAFINFLHDPQVAGENTNFIQYLCPNAPSYPLLSDEIRSNPGIFLDPELKARCEVIADLGDSNALYGQIWDQVKAAH